MGTTYVLQCSTEQGRSYDILLAKISNGYAPLLAGYKLNINRWGASKEPSNDITTWVEMKWLILEKLSEGAIIFDEYDRRISHTTFFELIPDRLKHARKNNWEDPIDYYIKGIDERYHQKSLPLSKYKRELKHYWWDKEGYSFAAREFG